MTPYLGDFAEDETIYTVFNTFTSDDPSASCTVTNFLNTDIHIHRDSGLTQRNNAAGVVVAIDYDGITGNHLITIDTSNDTVADFWITGHDYFVRAEGITIDGAQVNAFICHFSIENRFMRGTNSAATAAALTTHDGKLDTCDTVCDGIQTDLSNATDGLGALKALIDALHNLSAANVTTACTSSLNTYDPPKRSEATADKDAIIADLLTMKKKVAGAYDRETDSLEAIRNQGDAAWTTGAAPTVGEIRTEMEGNGYLLDRILDVTEIKHGLSVAAIGATTTKFISDLTETETGYWNRMAVMFTSGNDIGQMRRIKAYNGDSHEITLQTPLDTAPANGDTFVIPVVRAFITPDIEDIADQVCDELLSGHTATGSLGKAMADIETDIATHDQNVKALMFSEY